MGIPEDVIPEVTDAEEIPPDEPIVLEDEPEEAVVDTEAVEEPVFLNLVKPWKKWNSRMNRMNLNLLKL